MSAYLDRLFDAQIAKGADFFGTDLDPADATKYLIIGVATSDKPVKMCAKITVGATTKDFCLFNGVFLDPESFYSTRLPAHMGDTWNFVHMMSESIKLRSFVVIED